MLGHILPFLVIAYTAILRSYLHAYFADFCVINILALLIRLRVTFITCEDYCRLCR